MKKRNQWDKAHRAKDNTRRYSPWYLKTTSSSLRSNRSKMYMLGRMITGSHEARRVERVDPGWAKTATNQKCIQSKDKAGKKRGEEGRLRRKLVRATRRSLLIQMNFHRNTQNKTIISTTHLVKEPPLRITQGPVTVVAEEDPNKDSLNNSILSRLTWKGFLKVTEKIYFIMEMRTQQVQDQGKKEARGSPHISKDVGDRIALMISSMMYLLNISDFNFLSFWII